MRKGLLIAGTGLLGIIAIAVFALGGTDLITSLGRNIPQADVVTDYLTGVLWAGLLGLSIFFWPVPSRDKKYLHWAWAAKCLVTLGVMLFYESHYEGMDTFGYFYGSTHKWFYWDGLHLGNGTLNIRELCWLHARVFPDSFHLMKVNFSMVGFTAIYICYRAAVRFLQREDGRVFLTLALFPSVIFWSSTLGKDPIVLFGIALYVYGVAAWYRTGRLVYLALILLGVWESMLIRLWMGPILLAPLSIFLLSRMRGLLSKLLFLIPIIAVFLFATGRVLASRNIENSEDLVSTVDSTTHSTGWEGGSGQQSEHFTSLGVMATFVPLGAFTALFRPLPGEVNNAFGFLAGLENLCLLWLLLQAIKRTRLRELADPRVMWALALVLTWSFVYGFVSFQNLGAAVRYRLQILPVLLALLLYLRRKRPLQAASPVLGHPTLMSDPYHDAEKARQPV